MINIDEGTHTIGDPIHVKPSDQIFAELGNNTYDYRDLLSELIDNSLAAMVPDQFVHVTITIGISDSDPTKNWLTVRDDASGIPPERLGLAITPAGLQAKRSLNEHGLGMKQAVAGLGQLRYLATKVNGEEYTRVVEAFQFGYIYPKLLETPWDHGTEVAIDKLKATVRTYPQSYTRDVVPYLGARYRRFVTHSNPRSEIKLLMVDIDDVDANGDPPVINNWIVQEVKPTYFHRRSRRNAPEVDHRTFKGPGWEAQLVFGYSPDGREWDELQLKQPTRFDPYAVTLSRQGFDVLLNDRVIMFHQLPELGFVGTRHNNYNNVRGEIILKSGFTTAITKTSIISTDHWEDCKAQIKEFLDEHKYLERQIHPDPDALPEAALRDRLAVWLRTNDLAKKHDVKKEYAVEGLNGNIDVLADGEAWEIKRDEAYGLDVYQLFAYLDMTQFKKGYLLAKGFKDSARAACDHINTKHDVHIVLAPLEQFPINQRLSDGEIAQYL